MPIAKGQAAKVAVMVSDPLTGAGVTGVAADLSGWVSLGGQAAAPLSNGSATEVDATDMPGVYVWVLDAAETDDDLVIVYTKVLAPASGIATPVIVQTLDDVKLSGAIWTSPDRQLTASLDPTAAQIATAVWSETVRTLSEAGDTAIASAVWASVTRTLTASLDPTAAQIATAVWSETVRELSSTGNASAALAVWAATIRTLTIEGNSAITKDVLQQSVSIIEDTAGQHSLAELVLMATESSISGTTMTIRKTDGTTFATRQLTTDANADPIVGID